MSAATTWPPSGELQVSWTLGVGLTIEHADPIVYVTDGLLRGAQHQGGVTGEGRLGGLVRFHGVNRTVVYKLVDRDHETGQWLMQWPD